MSSSHNDPVGSLPQKQEPYHEHTLSRRPEIGQHEFVITSRITNNADQVPLSPSADEGPSPFIQAGIARKHLQPSTVTYLDGSKYTFYTHKNAEGEILFDMVAAQLNLSEKDYFGLAFYDDQSIRHWLYKDKRIVKQLKGLPWIFSFEVKFYPPQPSQLAEDLTRYLLCLQLRRDVYSEKLPVSFATQAKLGALAAQSEYGDFDKSEEYISYLKNAKIAQVISDELLDKVQELHKQYKGQTAPEAELAYLNECKALNMYGVHLFSAKDSKGKPVQVGVSSHGIGVYHDQMRIHRFAWVSIVKFSYRRHTFSIQLKPGELEKKETSVSYKLADYPAAKRLWKTAVEHHTFFRLIQPEVKQKRSILSFGSNRFRYQGRTQIQSHMASQLFDSSVPTVDRATGRVVSQSADNIASKTPVYASPLHYADAQSRDLGSSPEKSYHVGHPLATSTNKKLKKGDSTANEESDKKKDKNAKKDKKKKDADKKKLKKVKKGVDVSSDSSSSSSTSDAEIEVKSRETKSIQAHGQQEASLPHTTVHTWHESTNMPEQVTTEVDEHGNVVRRTIVKAEQVKHTVQTQSYQTYAVDENTAPASVLSHSPAGRAQPPPPPQRSDVPPQGVSPVNGTSPIETHTRTVAYENGIRSAQPTTDDFEPGDLVSTKAVTTGNRTVETLTYKKERDGVTETHVEHRITIHGGDDIDHDAELSRAILEATNMNPEMTVEKVDTKLERH